MTEKLRRNSSLTRGEIEAYWKSKKHTEEEHLPDISTLSPGASTISKSEVDNLRSRRSSSVPPDTRIAVNDNEKTESLEKIIRKNGWWISSKWAFLNEPPVIAAEGPAYKYASQFHVASNPRSPAGVGA